MWFEFCGTEQMAQNGGVQMRVRGGVQMASNLGTAIYPALPITPYYAGDGSGAQYVWLS